MEYPDKFLHEFARYVDSKSILVISPAGKLIRIFCPFPVVILSSLYQLEKGQIIFVDAVKVTKELKDVFIIKGKAYQIEHFGIIA